MKKMTALLLSAALLCPTLALAEDTVKIGIFEPMTGATAAGGSMEKEGFDLANELYPDVLGQKIELVYGDNKSDRAEATLAAQSLVDKGVVAVLGSYGSGLSMAGGEVFAESEIPALTATATNPTVTLDCEWYARICFIDPFQGTMLARYAVKNDYKKIAIMREKDSEYAVGLVKYFQDEIATHDGFEVVELCDFMNKDEDFSALLGAVLAQVAGCDFHLRLLRGQGCADHEAGARTWLRGRVLRRRHARRAGTVFHRGRCGGRFRLHHIL